MKNLIITLFVLSIALVSCDGGTVIQKSMDEFATVVIENCEYIYHEGNGYKSMTHKGNCSNSIHKCLNDTIYITKPIDSVEVAIGYLRKNNAFK